MHIGFRILGREMHTSDPLVPQLTHFKVEFVTGKFNRYKSPGVGELLAQLIRTGGNAPRSEVH
jgi:hypothetical protein